MSQTAQLREQIAARKFERNQTEVRISNMAEEIRKMIGTRWTPNKQIPFEAIREQAAAAAILSASRDRLEIEILQAEKDLEG